MDAFGRKWSKQRGQEAMRAHLAGPSDVAMVGYPLPFFFLAPLNSCANGHPPFTGIHLLQRGPSRLQPHSGNHPEREDGDGGIILALRG